MNNRLMMIFHLDTDFLRHAPCMRHVKSQYELCSKRYQNTMTKISQTTPDERQQQQNQQQHQQQQYHQQEQQYHQQEQQYHQPQYQQPQYQQQHSQPQLNNTRNEDDGIEGIKAVCW